MNEYSGILLESALLLIHHELSPTVPISGAGSTRVGYRRQLCLWIGKLLFCVKFKIKLHTHTMKPYNGYYSPS